MNKEIKERFIKEEYEEKTNLKFVQRSFINAEKYEDMIGKDIYDWSLDDITSFYKSLGSSSQARLANINLFYGNYVRWALKNNMVNDYQNNFDLINSDIMISCLNKRNLNSKIVTRKEVDECLDALPNPSDQFILLALFEGISGRRMEDIINVKLSDIDMENKRIKLFSGRIVNVSEKLINYAIQSEDEYEYYSLLGNERITHFIHIPDRVIKPKKNSRNLNVKLIRRVNTIAQFYGWSKNITSMAIITSGKIDMIHRRRTELNISAEEYMLKYKEELEEQYSASKKSASSFVKMYENYL